MSEKNTKGHFKIIKRTTFKEIAEGSETLPESDLCFQNNDHIFQYEYVKPPDESKYIIEPGIFTMIPTSSSVVLSKTEFKQRPMLKSVTNTTKIINEARIFFSRLHVYDELEQPKQRKILLYSPPGCGKTSAITEVCKEFITEDPGTVIMIWPTSNVEADNVSTFFSTGSEYNDKCTRLILIMEDIGGGERDASSSRQVDSGLLNLLDGVGVTFAKPTFTIATTNHPEHLLESLADRPGRFDLMISLKPPAYEERIQLLEFIAKRSITDEEKACLNAKDCNDFSIAHLVEIIIRSRLHDKSIPEVVEELIKHSKSFDKGFDEKKGKFGIGME